MKNLKKTYKELYLSFVSHTHTYMYIVFVPLFFVSWPLAKRGEGCVGGLPTPLKISLYLHFLKFRVCDYFYVDPLCFRILFWHFKRISFSVLIWVISFIFVKIMLLLCTFITIPWNISSILLWNIRISLLQAQRSSSKKENFI